MWMYFRGLFPRLRVSVHFNVCLGIDATEDFIISFATQFAKLMEIAFYVGVIHVSSFKKHSPRMKVKELLWRTDAEGNIPSNISNDV